MRATTIKSCDWPPCSFRTDIGATIHYPTIKSTTAEQRRRRSPVSTLLEWWWQWWWWWLYWWWWWMWWWSIRSTKPQEDNRAVYQLWSSGLLCPKITQDCLAPRFARGFTIPTKCICSGLFRIQRGFTISKVHQHLFRILWPCLRKPSNYGLSDSLGHLHSVVSAVINLVDMWYLFHFFSIRDPSSPKMRPPIFTK